MSNLGFQFYYSNSTLRCANRFVLFNQRKGHRKQKSLIKLLFQQAVELTHILGTFIFGWHN